MKKKRLLGGAIIGNILEYYDITLYGYMSAKLATIFFPASESFLAILASFGAFAAGFIMRPLGGIVFGHLADRWGRLRALTLSILLIAIATCAIGLLPSYEQAGLISPIILVLCRLLQGLSVGGEYGASTVFLLESVVDKKKSNFIASLLSASSFGGAILGTLLGALFTSSFMPEWGWRLPFILGSLTGLIGYYLRRTWASQCLPPISIVRFPLVNVIKNEARNLLCSIGIGAFSAVPFYLISIYMNLILINSLGCTNAQALTLNTVILVLFTSLLPIEGWIADKIGNQRIMGYAVLGTALVAYPLFWLLEKPSLGKIIIVQLVLSILGSSFLAGTNTFLASLFSPHYRCTGLSFGYCLGGALCGGTTPLIAAALVHWTGDPKSPALYLVFTSLLGWLGVTQAKQ